MLVEIHRWIGLVIGLALAFLMLTGIIAIVVEQTRERVEIRGELPPMTAERIGTDLQALFADTPNTTNGTIFLPTDARPGYRITEYIPAEGSQTGTRPVYHFVQPATLERLATEDPEAHSAFMDLVVDLHVSLIDGTDVNDYVGYGGAAISLLAIYLWWPFRRGFRWRNVVAPRTWRKEQMLLNHTAGGIASVAFLLVIAITGGMMGTRGTLTDWSHALEGETLAERYAPPALDVPQNADWADWSTLVAVAHDALPGATLATIATERGGALDFRFRGRAGDFSMFGQSHVYVDPYRAEVVQVYDLAEGSWLRWLLGMSRSLHIGEAMPTWYVVLLTLGCAVVTVIAFTGVFGFLRKLSKV